MGRALSLFGQYALLILLGAYVFYWDEAEQRAQEANGVPRTHTNALFFATVVATTVGYRRVPSGLDATVHATPHP